MGRGPALSDEEKGRIKGLYEGGFSLREIERRVTRSRGAISRVLFGEEKPRKKPGPAAAMTERETRLLLRTAAKGDHSARQLKNELSLSASVRTIQRVLAGVDGLIYTKMDSTLPLSAEDKKARRYGRGQGSSTRMPRGPGIPSSSPMRRNGISMGPTASRITGGTFVAA
ncbi:hypothetical protein PC116_g21269 [Phytophthora cactorum]|nr:hypothetical protein Pcac1_g7035 [Phytophthora cactorum]KAG4230436.1 hypothetical protein PC116_g21269 [Phytophthora cactorum]